MVGQDHFIVIDKSVDNADIPARVAKRFKLEFTPLKIKWILCHCHVIGADEFNIKDLGEDFPHI